MESVKDRVTWVLRNAQRHRTIMSFRAPAATVAASLSANLRTEFPSPKVQLVVAGRIVGSDPIRIRLRIFPHGARAGMLRGNDQSNWMKPTVVGRIISQGSTSELSYRLDANGLPASVGSAVLAILGLLSSLVLAVAGSYQSSLIALAIAAILSGMTLVLVGQADQGIREERLLYEWLLGTLKSFL
jgi:hypothetical protein